MKANYLKAVFLTLSMGSIVNNVQAMPLSLFSCTQKAVQTKEDEEKESDNNDTKENSPLLIVNGTGKSASFTINTSKINLYILQLPTDSV